MGSMRRYYRFSEYLKERFGEKVRRVCLDPGFPCPHKDPVSGAGGCVYCEGSSFSGSQMRGVSVREQLSSGIKASAAGGIKKHIAYFQNATPTNAPAADLRRALEPIREFPSVVALAVSTRPDCVDGEKLDLIAEYAGDYDVWVEYGIQSAKNSTLHAIGRGHTFQQAENAMKMTAERGIKVAVHVILGLPGETKDDIINTAREISRLPVWGVKLHVLHVLEGTALARKYFKNEVPLFTMEEYARVVCDFLENVPGDCVVLRLVSDARGEKLIAPLWINDKIRAINLIDSEFARRRTCQGCAIE